MATVPIGPFLVEKEIPSMLTRKVIRTEQAPAAIGPYSQGIVAGGFLFTAMQIPLDPASGTLVAPEDVAAQARRVLENLKAIVEAAGTSLGQVVKVTVYLQDIADFAAVNAVYGEYFSQDAPARAAVAVAALPRGARVAMEAVAVVA
jgi:2-iminobutanoate/2-iminopropanoate deaminase